MLLIFRLLFPLLLLINSSVGIHILDLLGEYGLSTTYGIRTELLPRFDEYDFIIIGSGPGGSPIASRLSENKNWRVLLLEAGKPEGILHQVPLLGGLFLNSEYDWQYQVVPQKNACFGMIDRICTYPHGKSLGGSSSINGMVYARGHKLDFDRWAEQGNYGWSYDDVLPYFKKSERANLEEPVDRSHHGRHGNVHVQSARWRSPLAPAFLKSGQQLGYDVIDYNGRHQIGFSYNQYTMVNGTRCSASKAYLRVQRRNLDIITEAFVSKILIDKTNRVYGVEFRKNNRSYTIDAKKEVVLSAGSINTPKLLMLSGIGPKDHLTELGIPVIKDSKVGYNLQDHLGFIGLLFFVNQSTTLKLTTSQGPEVVLQYAINGTGPLSSPGFHEGLAFTRTKHAVDARPDLEIIFPSGTYQINAEATARSGRGMSLQMYNALLKPFEGKDGIMILPAIQHPRSRGFIKLKSTNIDDPPLIDPNFLADQRDLEVLVHGIRFGIELINATAFQQFAPRLHETKIPGCERLEFGSDDYWRCAIQHLAIGFSHEVGTAKMGPAGDPTAVVDPELRVYGVKGLRVCDGSIIPDIPAGHLSATIYMIAEKAADMIKKSWYK